MEAGDERTDFVEAVTEGLNEDDRLNLSFDGVNPRKWT